MATKRMANGWLATAAAEFRQIRLRWGNPPLTKFSKLLGINYRTVSKLLSPNPPETMKLETILQAFTNLRAKVWSEFNTTEDANNEIKNLEHSMMNIVLSCYPPNRAFADEAIHEMENQQGCGVMVK